MLQTDRYCTGCKTNKLKDEFKTQNMCHSCYHIRRSARSGADLLHYFRKGISKLKSTRIKQGVEFLVNAEDLMELWDAQGGKCALSGVFMTHAPNGDPFTSKNASVDRLDHSKGYYPQNVQLVCSAVNMLRGPLSQEDFTWWILNIYKHHCE
jgi:hypothetical protein